MISRPAGNTRTLPGRSHAGFTLVELMISLVVFALLAAAVVGVLVASSKQKTATANEVGSTQMARVALEMLTRDLRSAGFGADLDYKNTQRPIAYIDQSQVLINADISPFPDTLQTKRGIPLAYNPTGFPRPKPLDGTSWTPSVRYTTGAETIRWTLDLNNDGVVNSTDLLQDDAADAKRTKNPNDYELVREVYGDSTGGTQGNNGGARERVALIKRPGGGAPAIFTVYLSGDAGAWDWNNGPVPANRLGEIKRIDVTVVATSPNKNFLGKYSDVRLTSSVNELRNSPNFKWINYDVAGFVFKDVNLNGSKDVGETGIAGVPLTLGGYLSTTTGSTGYYTFTVPPGTYVLKHQPPANYYTVTNPDSFIVTVGPASNQDFAEGLRQGGWLTLTVYNDVDKNHSYGGSDQPLADIPVTLVSTGQIFNTDASGVASIFLPVGTSQVSAALPDSFVFSTANPVSVSMTNGGTKTASIGMYVNDAGIVSGTVFNDYDGDGVKDAGEGGVQDANLSVILPDSTVVFTYSDKSGAYTLKLPANDPPRTTPYTITCTPPPGYSTGSPLTIANVFVQNRQTVANNNFALGKYSLWQHDIDDPLSEIAAADFIENDWQGNPKHAHQDKDLVVGTDRTDTSELQQWFNWYDGSPPFKTPKSTTRTMTHSVMAVACDTLDAASPDGFCRPDVIAGTAYRPTGNWTIWLTQNGSGNEGFLPAVRTQSYLTNDNGNVQKILTYSGGAGQAPVIMLGTRSPAFGTGTIEVWKSASHTTPAYARTQLIPPTGLVPGNNLGEVAGMALADLNGDGVQELVVGTLTGFYTGQVMVFKQVAGVWTYAWGTTLSSDAVSAVTVSDIDNDGKKDIVAGTQSGLTSGNLFYYRNTSTSTVTSFAAPVIRAAQGVITCLDKADYGSDGIDDIIVGWRDSDLTFRGGLEIWYTTTHTLPTSGVDATDGKVNKWVQSLVIGDFNYGLWPTKPKNPGLPDIVAVVRRDRTHGTLVVLVH